MDPISLIFYACICGTLGWASPALGHPVIRLIIGAIVGLIAATVLPMIKGALY